MWTILLKKVFKGLFKTIRWNNIFCVLSVCTKHNNGFICEIKQIQILFPKKKHYFYDNKYGIDITSTEYYP